MFSMAGERRWNPAWTVNEAPVVRWEDLHGPCRLHNTTVLGKRAPVEVILANPTSEQWCRVGVLVTVHLVAKYTYRMMSDWPCVSALVGSCLRLGCSTSRTRTSQSLSVEHSSPRSSTRCISATRAAPTTVAMAETPQRNRRLIRHAGGSGREAVPRLRQICREEPVSPQIIPGERMETVRFEHCCLRTAEEMPMLVNLYSWEWLQTYSREVEMHIYKEGDQITAQSHVLDQVRWRDAWVFPAG